MEIDSIAITKKCNAIIVTIIYYDCLSLEYIQGRLLNSWDKLSKNGILDFKKDIKFYHNNDALQYLAESSVGIHSVTTGDSQVLSQISDGFKNGLNRKNDYLSLINNWIHSVADECRLKTDIFKGNTSLERIASDYIIQKTDKDKDILLVGYGKSGKLIAKILNRENNRPLLILNRTHVNPAKELLHSNTIYYDFNTITSINFKNISACIIALSYNSETNKIIKSLVSKISNNILFIDISTPPFLTGIIDHFLSLDGLSKIAQKTVNHRKDAVSKAKTIITQNLKTIISFINSVVIKDYMLEQKQQNFHLNSDKISLIEMRSEMFSFIRHYLIQEGFLEIFTPFIVGVSTDPPKVDLGSTINVTWINEANAFLRQSNQLYKQLYVTSGVKKVYEIGPFWRNEANESYRHLQESIGLDIEMQKPKNLQELYELACLIIQKTNQQIIKKFNLNNHLIIPDIKSIPVLTYDEAVNLLRKNGHPVIRGEDFGLVSESKLRQIIKKEFRCDILVIKNYPDTIKKFYTKQKSKGLTETFDIIVDGWELVSGAIRQTDGVLIRKSMKLSDIHTADYEFYISAIDKSIEHGGFCLGLDRLMAKILDFDIITDAVPFPRTHKKLIP